MDRQIEPWYLIENTQTSPYIGRCLIYDTCRTVNQSEKGRLSISGSLKQSDIHIKKERKPTPTLYTNVLVGGYDLTVRQNHKYFRRQYRE